jgi:hypothetical protein
MTTVSVFSGRWYRALSLTTKALGLVGAVGFVIWVISAMWYGRFGTKFNEPLQRYGGSFANLYEVVFGLYGAVWLISLIVDYRATRDPDRAQMVVVFALIGGVALGTAALGASMGITCLNALLDFSPLQETPVHVRDAWEKAERYKGQTSHVKMAIVNRLDHPNERVELNWDSCKIPHGDPPSASATIRIGRGAFGIPWVALPVQCHALTITEEPLFGDFYLGKGSPAIIFTVERSDNASSDERVAMYSKWRRSIEEVAPQIPLFMFWEGPTPDKIIAAACPRCTLVHDKDVNSHVFDFFTKQSVFPFWYPDDVFLANAKGEAAAWSPISNTDAMSEFIYRLKAATK